MSFQSRGRQAYFQFCVRYTCGEVFVQSAVLRVAQTTLSSSIAIIVSEVIQKNISLNSLVNVVINRSALMTIADDNIHRQQKVHVFMKKALSTGISMRNSIASQISCNLISIIESCI